MSLDMSQSKNPLVLSYHDTVLRDTDLEILRGPNWLNDSIIGFFFEYLQHYVHANDNSLLFISPEVTQCLKGSSSAELPVFLDPLNAREKQFIFLPLNDCEISDRPGGSHWSLIVWSKPENKFFHLDSFSGSNYRQATNLVGKLTRYIAEDGGDFEEADCVQQKNCYDCGIHVLVNAELLASHCLSKSKVEGSEVSELGRVSNQRADILSIIKRLADRK